MAQFGTQGVESFHEVTADSMTVGTDSSYGQSDREPPRATSTAVAQGVARYIRHLLFLMRDETGVSECREHVTDRAVTHRQKR